MIRLFVVVEDITAVMAEGYTVVRVYTDTAVDGTFATLDGTITLVAGQESYEYTDSDGTNATWYKTAYFGAVPGVGDQSEARKGETSAAYATVLELRHHIDMTGITDDWEVAQLLDGAARTIDRKCKRPDGFFADVTASARYYVGSGRPYQRIDECALVTAVAVKDSPSDDEGDYTAWTVGTVGSTTSADCFPASGSVRAPNYTKTPYNLLIVGANGDYSNFISGEFTSRGGFRPSYTVSRGTPTVQVTANWGFSATIPDDIKMANLMQAARWYKRVQGSMADMTAGAEFGELMFRQRLDPDVALILVDGGYIKTAIG